MCQPYIESDNNNNNILCAFSHKNGIAIAILAY